MRIALCQLNTTVGDYSGNSARIVDFAAAVDVPAGSYRAIHVRCTSDAEEPDRRLSSLKLAGTDEDEGGFQRNAVIWERSLDVFSWLAPGSQDTLRCHACVSGIRLGQKNESETT